MGPEKQIQAGPMRRLYADVLSVDRSTLLRHAKMSRLEQLRIAESPDDRYWEKACVAAVTRYVDVMLELAKSNDDAVRLAFDLNKNLTTEGLSILHMKNPICGNFMGRANGSVQLFSYYGDIYPGVKPIVVARTTKDDGFMIIEGFVKEESKTNGM
ncbi:MAG: hypothetical protein KGH94_01050 [Candidatus Micrarchaeota archaeon]|nr:hypothetical protein [Candidatus Micrarchaeota archaeon]